MKTVVGLFANAAGATRAKTALVSEGFDAANINVMDHTTDNAESSSTETSLSTRVKDFFGGFSDHKDQHADYANSIGNGNVMLAVTAPDDQAEATADTLYSHGATGIQGGQNSTRTEEIAAVPGNTSAASAITGEQVIPVVQEDLVVGKRQVDRGGVRIYSHLVEQAVSADVTLHDERVVLERRVIDRPATEADFATGTGVIELTATGEEAVVGKTSRVVEEVRVGKQGTDHTEQINDTVRHTEVEVEPVTTTSANTLTSTKDRY